MWSQLLQCSQLSQSTTIVATPITIVTKNYNCCNCNHNCRYLINHKCRNCNHNCCNLFLKKRWSCKYWYVIKRWSFLERYNYIFHNIAAILPCSIASTIYLYHKIWALTPNLAIFFLQGLVLHHSFRYVFRKEKPSENEICLGVDKKHVTRFCWPNWTLFLDLRQRI